MELQENERLDDLEYNNLKIIQNKKNFCFGIDSILLSNFAKKIKKGQVCVDIGTGNGIISLLLASKTNLKKIYGIEVQESVAKLANRNVLLNNLEDKIEIINLNIKNIFEKLDKNTIDVIVTNPPYMKNNTGAKNEDITKLIARHEIECNLEDVIKISYSLLKSNGEFYMIHKANRIADILYLMKKYKIEPKVLRFISPKNNEPTNLVLVKGIKDAGEELKIEKNLIVYNDDNTYTDEILKIYGKKE